MVRDSMVRDNLSTQLLSSPTLKPLAIYKFFQVCMKDTSITYKIWFITFHFNSWLSHNKYSKTALILFSKIKNFVKISVFCKFLCGLLKYFYDLNFIWCSITYLINEVNLKVKYGLEQMLLPKNWFSSQDHFLWNRPN